MSAINLGQPENYFLLTKIISGCCTLMQGILCTMYDVLKSKKRTHTKTRAKRRPHALIT